jgi:Phospholipase_D-nuclease N-terminal
MLSRRPIYFPILLLVSIAFAILTVLALRDHGYWGIIEPHFQSFGAGQVFADLVIALSLAMVWLWRDARKQGRNPWVWLIVILAVGSFGPLLYLLTRRPSKETASAFDARRASTQVQ